jgi:dihydrofolate synthase/folylpolyglutamate synthase
MKPGVPVVTGLQPETVLQVFRTEAARVGAGLAARNAEWTITATETGLRYTDASGSIDLPKPSLPGTFQHDNAGIAVAAIRASGLAISGEAIAQGIAKAEWPARLQRLTGRLAATLPHGWELWLDGGHNPGGGQALADHATIWSDRPLHIIVGMKKAKDSAEFLRPLIPHATSLWAVSEPGQHLALPVEDIVAASGGVAQPGPTVREALSKLHPSDAARVLICGSLYLAGEVLKADET